MTIPSKYEAMFQLGGQDQGLFHVEYPGKVFLARPLPSGEYRFYFIDTPKRYIVCDDMPEEEKKRQEHFVAVASLPGTVHEAFFDPVAQGTAVVADDYRGALKPASFGADGAETAIRRIGWDTNRAWVEFSSAPSLANHHIDFIELDGSVGLRLDVDDAAAVATGDGGQALVWGVCDQPWAAGDLLMLRISASGDTLTGVTNDATCDGAPVSLTVPLQTANFYPTSDAYIKPTISVTGECGSPGLWNCLDEAKADGDGSAVILFAGSALRVGFTVPSDAIPGTIEDVRFEVGMKAQSGTVEAGNYGFAVYSGGAAVATVDGAGAVGSEWTQLVVSDGAMTSGLSGGVTDASFQINGPASGSRLLVTWVKLVVDYDPTGS